METDHTDDLIELDLTAMANGGSAIGRHRGRVVFVPYAIPGERARVRIVEERGRVLFAEGVMLVDASADRVYPLCPHFGPGRCGRCQWQHISYEAQLLIKQDVLADQLSRIGEFDDGLIAHVLRPIVPSPQAWHYLDRLTFTVTPDGLSLPGAAGGSLTVVDQCSILHADLVETLGRVHFEDASRIQRVTLARGSDGAQMLVLAVADLEDVPEMELDFTASVNLLLPDNTPVNLIGDLALEYDIGGRRFRVTAGSYIRGSTGQLPALIGAVMDALAPQGGEHVLDLYGGVGALGAAAAERGAAVTLVESYPPAADDARTNLSEFQSAVIEQSSVEDFLAAESGTFGAVIVDPPPDGLAVSVVDALARLRPPRLVYVSSDAATFARDARRLAKQGFVLRGVQPVDLSPQTYYIDTVAEFEPGVS